MASVEELLRLGLQDDLSGPLTKVIRNLDKTDKSIQQTQRSVTDLTKDLDKNGKAFEETGQKYVDAQRKLSEYGATADQQRFILKKAADMAGKYGLSVDKAAIVVEELAIETQDANQVLLLQSKAYEFVAKSSKRAEDAVGDFVDLTKGGTGALRELGKRGAAIADALDKIEDPAKRARLALAAHEKEQARVNKRGIMGTNVMDFFAQAQAKVAAAGPLVSGALMAGVAAFAAVGAAALAAGAAFVSFAKDSVGVALKEVKEFEIGVSDVKNSWKELQKAFGTALIAGDQVREGADQFHEFARMIDEVTKAIKENAGEIKSFVDTTIEVGTAVAMTITQIGGSVFTYIAGVWDVLRSAVMGGALLLNETVAKLASQVLELGAQLGIISTETANRYEKSRRELSKTFDEGIGFKFAKGVDEYKNKLMEAIQAIGAFLTSARAVQDVERKDFRNKGKGSPADTVLPGEDEIDFGANMAFTTEEELEILRMKMEKGAQQAAAALSDPRLKKALEDVKKVLQELPGKINKVKEEHESFMFNLKEAVPDYVNAWEEGFKVIGQAAKSSLDQVANGIAAVSGALVKGTNAGSAFGAAMLSGFGNTLQQMGEGYIELGALMALTGDPTGFAVAAGGGLLVGIGAGMSAQATKLGPKKKGSARKKNNAGSASAPAAAFAGGGFSSAQPINLAVQLNIADQTFDDAVDSSVRRNAMSNR